MIVNERVVAYINSLDCGNSDICNTIEKEAIADEVPIIRKEMGNLLKVLLQLVQPERILEVGTAVGYSSILMSENMPENCKITTIQRIMIREYLWQRITSKGQARRML
jgi:predicted O-methyltransferase YrrM